jgi:hypothetical protein
MTGVTRFLATTAAVLSIGGCSMTPTGASRAADSSGRATSTSTPSDSANIVRLESEALALVHNDGCPTVDQCRIAPVGAKACGGPRFWITFCSLSTDSAALFRKLDELRTAEQNFNVAHGVISDCSVVVPPPTVVAIAGVCRVGN